MTHETDWDSFTVLLRPDVKQTLQDIRWERRVRSVGDIVREAIDQYLAAHSSREGSQPSPPR